MQHTKRKNDYSQVFDTLFWNVFYIAIMWAWYRNAFFRCFGQLSLTESRILLLCIVLSSALLGYVIDCYILKKKPHSFFNLLFGFGVYAAMTYISIKPHLIIISISASVIMAAAYSVWLNCKKTRDYDGIRRAISSSKQIVSAGFVIILAVIGFSVIFRGYLIKPTVYPAKTIESAEEWTISNRIETLSLFFDEERWEKLSLTTKLDTCQVLANICQAEWGTNELNVFASNTSDVLAGYYDDKEHMIQINVDYLMTASGSKVCNTVVHEAFHALEHRSVDAFLAAPDDMKGLEIYKNAVVYMQEFSDYHNCEDDYYLYADQLCEKHARLWADYMTREIECAVADYYGGQNGRNY